MQVVNLHGGAVKNAVLAVFLRRYAAAAAQNVGQRQLVIGQHQLDRAHTVAQHIVQLGQKLRQAAAGLGARQQNVRVKRNGVRHIAFVVDHQLGDALAVKATQNFIGHGQLFGGLGYNFANPALVGRIVLFLGFTSRMTAYVYPDMSVDALASATPLNAAVDLHSVSFVDMLLGIHGGMMGETCVIAILLGLAYLLFTHTIEFTIPASIVGTMYVLTLLATRDPYIALLDCMSGGLLFGAVFMATDYVTSPFTTKGKLFYGVFIGLVTFLIRNFASMNEGMSFAILLGNLMTPWFNAWGHQTPLGYKKPKKAKKGGAE